MNLRKSCCRCISRRQLASFGFQTVNRWVSAEAIRRTEHPKRNSEETTGGRRANRSSSLKGKLGKKLRKVAVLNTVLQTSTPFHDSQQQEDVYTTDSTRREHRRFFDRLAEELGIQRQSDWYSVTLVAL